MGGTFAGNCGNCDEFKQIAKELLISIHKIEIMLAKMEKE